MIMENLAKDEMYRIETDCEIIEFTPGINNLDARPELPCDEIDTWARQALAANGFGDY
jgi:hypothetical protein